MFYVSEVQTWAAKITANMLQQQSGVSIQLKKLALRFPSTLEIEDLLIRDLQGDTLLYCENVASSLEAANNDWSQLVLGDTRISKPFFRIVTPASDSLSNLDRVLGKLPPSSGDSTRSFSLFNAGLTIANGRFTMLQPSADSTSSIVFDSLQVHSIHARVNDFVLVDDSIGIAISSLTAEEPQGLSLQQFVGTFGYSPRQLSFQNFQLRTNKSRLDGSLAFHYEESRGMSNFTERVRMEANIRPSKLLLSDLAVFVPSFQGIEDDILFRGEFSGPIADLQGNDVIIEWGNTSYFRGNFYTYGLPKITESYIDFDVDYMKTNYKDLVFLDVFERADSSLIPSEFEHLGSINFNGNFSGYVNNFVAYGALETEIGSLNSDIVVNSSGDTVRFSGDLSAKRFDLGRYFQNNTLGSLTARLNLKGQGITLDRLQARVKGTVYGLGIRSYNYQNIQLDGAFTQKTFEGSLDCTDPNFNVNFNGLVDFNQTLPRYNFVADVFNLDFNRLNWVSDSISISSSGRIQLKGSGDNFQNFTGEAKAQNISYCRQDDEVFLDDINITAEKQGKKRIVNLRSNIGQATLQGDIYPEHLVTDLNHTLTDISSIYFSDVASRTGPGQDFTLELYVTDADLLSRLLDKTVAIRGGFQLLGYYKSQQNEIGFNTTCDDFMFENYRFHQLVLEGNKRGRVTNLWFNSDSTLASDIMLGRTDFSLKGVVDNFQTSISWNNNPRSEGTIEGLIEITGKNKGVVSWLPSEAVFENTTWKLSENASTYWDSTGLYFQNVSFANKFQEIALNGSFSRKLSETQFAISTKNFSLSNLNILTNDNPRIEGVANGGIALSLIQDSIALESNLEIKQTALNGNKVGDIALQSNQQQVANNLGFSGSIVQAGGTGQLRFYGNYTPNTQNPLLLNFDFNRFDLSFLNNTLTEDVTQIAGLASGNIKLEGKVSEPRLRGKMLIRDGYFFIPYLQTGFGFSDEVIFRPDYIALNHISIQDDAGKQAFLTGTVLHENFSNWNYDFFAELSNNLVLNTDKFDNTTFYGKAFVSGTADISGYGNNTLIEVNVAPEKNSQINIPLGGVEEVENLDYVTFIDPNAKEEAETEVDLSGISLNFTFDVNPNAELRIIFDETVGDVITSTGSGQLKMNIDTRSNFEMFGKYEVLDGDYLFTLQNLVNKRFDIMEGGTINWFGDPYEAIIDVKARYQAQAALYDILATPDDRYKRREPVVVEMHLKDRLINPDIGFDILLPNADDFVRGQVRSVVNNEQEMNRQVFSLLALQRFVPPANSNLANEGSRLGNTVGTTTSEFFSNQLSNIASQISSDFNLGINYRPGDQLSRNELAVAVSTQLFNERVSISSRLGVTDRSASNPNGLVGDFEVGYALTRDGRVQLKAFNETADNIYTGSNLSPFIQGVGVTYRTEFDNLPELWQRFKARFRREKPE